MATTTTSKALITAAFIAGGATTLTARQLFSSANAAVGYRFQNDHVWVASLNPDGGMPTYAGRTCGIVKAADAGFLDACSADGAELTVTEAKAFETYLKARGIAAPRK